METKLFKEIAAEWADAKRKMVKHSTFCAYNLILHTHLLPLFGDNAVVTEAEAQNIGVMMALCSGMRIGKSAH